jgi:hypothetical protein
MSARVEVEDVADADADGAEEALVGALELAVVKDLDEQLGAGADVAAGRARAGSARARAKVRAARRESSRRARAAITDTRHVRRPSAWTRCGGVCTHAARSAAQHKTRADAHVKAFVPVRRERLLEGCGLARGGCAVDGDEGKGVGEAEEVALDEA